MNRISQIVEKVVKANSVYQGIIHSILQRLGRTDIDPRYVEAYLRSEFRNLDGLSHSKFVQVVPEIVEAIDADPRQAEQLADSYSL